MRTAGPSNPQVEYSHLSRSGPGVASMVKRRDNIEQMMDSQKILAVLEDALEKVSHAKSE